MMLRSAQFRPPTHSPDKQQQQQQWQQHPSAAAAMCSNVPPSHHSPAAPADTLSEDVIEDIASRLTGGSRRNFSNTCTAFNQAVKRQTNSLDLYELCGWGDGSKDVPESALLAAEQYPSAIHITLPSGWRHLGIRKLLHRAANCPNTWKQLSSITLHFHALSPSTCAAIAQLAPGVTKLTLSLDLAYEQTSRQAWRMASLLRLSQLQSLALQADLRTEALQVLSGLPRLCNLQLVSRSSHPAASLAALTSLTGLTALRFNWQAGRTLTDARLISNLSSNLKDLQIWLSAGQGLPPCSSKPLSGLMAALGTLTALTSLQLLQGLYMSWDLRTISHLAGLNQLQVLGLHDSVVSEFELALLAACTALSTLKVDAIKLHAVHSNAAAAAAGPEEAELAAGQNAYQAAAAAAAGLQEPATNSSSRVLQPHLMTLGRLQRVEVNMLQLGLWQLAEVCPNLQTLTPLECTLGAKGHGVVWDLGAIEGHPRLQTLGLMLGALGTTVTYNRSLEISDSAESIAAAVLRVILQSAGINRTGGSPGGCSLRQLITVMRSFPRLKQLQLWGHAGGVSGRLLASLHSLQPALSKEVLVYSSSAVLADAVSCVPPPTGYHQCCISPSSSSGRSRCSSHGEASSSNSPAACGCAHLQRSSSGGSSIVAAVGDVLCSLGSLISPRSRMNNAAAAAGVLPAPAFAAAGGLISSDSFSANSEGLGDIGGFQLANVDHAYQQQQQQPIDPCTDVQDAPMHPSPVAQRCFCSTAGCCPLVGCGRCPAADYHVVVQLLQGLPGLELLQLLQCDHLSQGGVQLAAKCCGRFSQAVVMVAGSK